jgi:hypothetical protein
MQIRTLISPVLDDTEPHRTKHGRSTQHEQTERPKDQRPVRLHATGELLPPDKEEDGHARSHLFLFLSFILPVFTSIP